MCFIHVKGKEVVHTISHFQVNNDSTVLAIEVSWQKVTIKSLMSRRSKILRGQSYKRSSIVIDDSRVEIKVFLVR